MAEWDSTGALDRWLTWHRAREEADRRRAAAVIEADRVRDEAYAESRGNGRGWNRENHWTDGTCPKPERKLCGSCDAGLPMSYTCIEPPKESN